MLIQEDDESKNYIIGVVVGRHEKYGYALLRLNRINYLLNDIQELKNQLQLQVAEKTDCVNNNQSSSDESSKRRKLK